MAAKKFLRHNWFRHRKLGLKWRRPKGRHSKMREHRRGKPPLVKAGYGTPVLLRNIHPSGFQEIMISNPKELERVDPALHAIRIKGNVGVRKRAEMLKMAEQRKIKVLNPKKARVTNRIRGLEARKQKKEKPKGESPVKAESGKVAKSEQTKRGV